MTIMRLINYIKTFQDGGLKRPKNVTDAQWKTALDLYNNSKRLGDKYPELTVAQAVLETGWFKTTSGNYNYFGQKAGKGQPSVALKTKEEGKNGFYNTTANFRTYNSIDESLQDRLKKWGSKYEKASNVGEALDIVVKNGYATDSQYKRKINSILGSFGIKGSKTPDVDKNYYNEPTNNQPSVLIGRNDLSGQAFASAISGQENKSQEELVKFQAELEKQKQDEITKKTKEAEDIQHQQLLQAQQEKESFYNMMLQSTPEQLAYDTSPTETAFSNVPNFQFQNSWYGGEGLFQEGGRVSVLNKIKQNCSKK